MVFNILGVHWKIRLLGRGYSRKSNIEGDCLKRGTWTVYQFKGRGVGRLAAKRVADTQMHIYIYTYVYIYVYTVCDHEITQAMQFADTSF